MAIQLIPVRDIQDNPFQPRTEASFDKASIQSLADEIREEGVWEGALQARRKDGRIELVFGHRRLRALRLLKMPSVRVDVLDLTDTQMALRSLEENLQRLGLTDLEKADAVKRAVDLVAADRKAAGKPARGALQIVADRLGLAHGWVGELCKISDSMESELRAPIVDGAVTAKTALVAKQWGGETYVKTLAKQGKKAKTDPNVSKPTHKTVEGMKKAVKKAPEKVRETLKQEIVTGKIVTPVDAEKRARQLASTQVRREKQAPPDLKAVIVDWTHRLKEWERQMREVKPYMDYVEEVPAIAANFRTALRSLIAAGEALL